MDDVALGAVNANGLLCVISTPVALVGLIAWHRYHRRPKTNTRLEPYRTKCRACGYELRGITSLQCPECGAVRETYKTALELQAMEIVARSKARFERVLTYRPATEADFASLDRDFYESTTSDLIDRGFHPLGDLVNTSDRRGKGPVLRILVSNDGTTCVMICHLNPRRLPARLEGRDLGLCQAQTEFVDGRLLETSNAESIDVTTPPPEILRLALPPDTPVLAVLEEHEGRKRYHELNAACVPYSTLDDVLAARQRQHQHQLAFRRRIGYADPDEVRRLALLEGSTANAAEKLANAVDEIRKRQMKTGPETGRGLATADSETRACADHTASGPAGRSGGGEAR